MLNRPQSPLWPSRSTLHSGSTSKVQPSTLSFQPLDPHYESSIKTFLTNLPAAVSSPAAVAIPSSLSQSKGNELTHNSQNRRIPQQDSHPIVQWQLAPSLLCTRPDDFLDRLVPRCLVRYPSILKYHQLLFYYFLDLSPTPPFSTL